MAIGKVEICGVDTSTLPVISNERMRQLFPLVHGGDMQARASVVIEYGEEVRKIEQRMAELAAADEAAAQNSGGQYSAADEH